MVKELTLTLFFAFILSAVFISIKPEKYSSNILSSRFWIKKAYDEKPRELIIFGDSRVYRGANPDIIAKYAFPEIPISNLNLGFSSAGFNNEIFKKIEKLIDFNSPNKVLILGITPNEFTLKASENEHYFRLQTNRIDALIRISVLKHLSIFDNYSLTELYKRRKDPKNGYYETFYENGWVKSDVIPPDTLAALESYRKEFINNKINEGVMQSLFLFISDLKARGVIVFGYYPPIAHNLRELEKAESGFDFERFKLQFKSNGGYWIDIDQSKYETYDGSHLTSTSAIKLSEELGKQIATEKNICNK